MQFSEKPNLTRWIIIMASFVIVILILWNTYSFFQIFKNDERVKMEVWAESLKTLLNADPLEDDVELPRQVMSNNKTIPIILTEKGAIINTTNIDENIVKNKIRLSDFLEKLKKQNDPIVIRIGPGQVQYLYYGNSSLLNNLPKEFIDCSIVPGVPFKSSSNIFSNPIFPGEARLMSPK